MEIKILQKSRHNFHCEKCDYYALKKSDYEKHISTRKHKMAINIAGMEINGNEIPVKKSPESNYSCEKCNFYTTNISNYNAHLLTKKHTSNVSDEPANPKIYNCKNCNKEFLNSSGLWKHNKKCQSKENLNNQNDNSSNLTNEMIFEVLKNSKELQKFLMEQNNKLMEQHTVSMEQNNKLMEIVKTNSVGINNSNNNSNNTTNNQFNLQFFLNETCKDAMNITDFVNSLQITTQDFENTGKVGFIEGITQIIINRLNSVDTTKRPMHCTDAKRETLYIKDDNVWNKDSEDKAKFKKVVNQVANKNLQQLNRWKDEHPDCINLDTPDNIDFRKYYRVALGGASNEEDDKFFEKIKRNVLKEIVVDKSV